MFKMPSRRPRLPVDRDDRLVQIPQIATLIGRDPSRVRRYLDSDELPPANTTVGGKPAWYESSIRSWWAARTAPPDPAAVPRYRRAWGTGRTPTLIAQWVMTITAQGWSEGQEIHIRVFAAMDGGDPVVVLQLLDGGMHYDRHSRELLPQIRAYSPIDLDRPGIQWIWLETYSWDTLLMAEGVPPELDLWDLNGAREPDGRPAIPTELDLYRLIGMPIDVFPAGLHTRATITAREDRAGAAFPTAILTDDAGVERLLDHLDALTDPARRPTDLHRTAAALLAERITKLVDQLDNLTRKTAPASLDRSSHHRGLTTLAVVRQPRTLSQLERKFVQELMPETPTWDGTTTSAASGSPWGSPRAVLRPGLAADLAAIRVALLDPDLPDDDPVRKALSAAEQEAVSLLGLADPSFRIRDRAPEIQTYQADTPEMAAYLRTLQPQGTNPDLLPTHLIRRGRALLAAVDDQYRPPADAPVLHWDPLNEVLSCTYIKPGRRWAPSYQRPSADTPPEPSVTMEWPMAGTVENELHHPDGVLVAPAAEYGVYRPLFLRVNGTIRLIPAGHRTVWGVSSTDTLSPLIHKLFRSPEENPYDWLGYPNLRHLLTACGAEPLAVSTAQITEIYVAFSGPGHAALRQPPN